MTFANYAITIKCVKKDYFATEQELINYYHEIVARHAGSESFTVYEWDSKNRLHLHGQFYARKNLRYTLVKIPYVHINILPLKTEEDIKLWYEYCNKDQLDQKQFLKDIQNENLFQN